MSLTTPNLDLPYIAPAQAQKHVTHNEAIRALDALVQLSVMAVQDVPPTDPENGMRYIIGQAPSGIFENRAGHIAAYQDGAWAFYSPQAGWQAYDQNQSALLIFKNDDWQALSGGDEALPEMAPRFGINGTADDVNKLLLQSEASLFNHDGAGHQFKINKAAEADSASLLYQSGFAGHAEMGLTGNNDFSVNVSPDGGNFLNAMRVDKATADVRFEHGTDRDKLLPTMPNTGDGAEFNGFPNLSTIATAQTNITLTANRLYFGAMWVDRPTEITGGLVVVSTPSSDANTVMRLGIYDIGQPNGSSWRLGARRADFGAQPLSSSGGMEFTADQPVLLERGWYMFGLGVNGPGAIIRYLQSFTPGLCQYSIPSETSSALFRLVGPSLYCFLNNRADDIQTGFPENFSTDFTDVSSTILRSYTFFIPKFRHWNAP